MNRKIRNTTPLIYKGIKYKSILEVSCVKELEKAGLNFRYEKEKFNIIEGFTPALHFYQSVQKGLVKQDKKNGDCIAMKPISYTPDFWYGDDHVLIFIETKGYKNDVYPYKRKLFFRHMSEYKLRYKENMEIYFFELKNVRDIKESINIIKDIIKNEYKKNIGLHKKIS